MKETINIDCRHIWNAIQRLRKANANMIMVENEIARVISEHGVEQKHGHWDYYGFDEISNVHIYRCSECECGSREAANYCGNCGTKMDEVTE